MERFEAALFLALIAGGTLASLGARVERPEAKGLLDGRWAKAYETAFNRALPWRDLGIATWAAIDYFGFGAARSGALVGEDGWLFTAEEFQSSPDGEGAEMERKLQAVDRVKALVESRGGRLLVALVPAKARVREDRLGRYRLPASARRRYALFRRRLLDRGVLAPDLCAALAAAPPSESFLRTDTHWSPAGARRAARAVAEALRESGLADGLPRAAFKTVSRQPLLRRGDLLRYLPLGPLSVFGPDADRVDGARTVAVASSRGAAALLGDAAAPAVALVGTSYSADSTWDFSGALADALGADVLNASLEGQGPIAPMASYLRGDDFARSAPRIVVWEMPERYVPVHDDVALP